MNYDVADWVFKSFIPKNSLVFDPFMGTGTTAIACINNECDYIGLEISKEYYDISQERLKKGKNK